MIGGNNIITYRDDNFEADFPIIEDNETENIGFEREVSVDSENLYISLEEGDFQQADLKNGVWIYEGVEYEYYEHHVVGNRMIKMQLHIKG